jgi:hypothetical protein
MHVSLANSAASGLLARFLHEKFSLFLLVYDSLIKVPSLLKAKNVGKWGELC